MCLSRSKIVTLFLNLQLNEIAWSLTFLMIERSGIMSPLLHGLSSRRFILSLIMSCLGKKCLIMSSLIIFYDWLNKQVSWGKIRSQDYDNLDELLHQVRCQQLGIC